MMQFAKFKSLCKILALTIFLQPVLPVYLYAAEQGQQQSNVPSAQAKPTGDKPAAPQAGSANQSQAPIIPDGMKRPWPWFGDEKEGLWEWKFPNANPVLPMSRIPGWGVTEENDKQILRSIILGKRGVNLEEYTRLLYLTLKLNLFDGKEPDSFFTEDLKLIAHNMDFRKREVVQGEPLDCRMPEGMIGEDGKRSVELSPRIAQVGANADVDFAYAFAPIYVRTGPYRDQLVSLLWFPCGNVSCVRAEKVLGDKEDISLTAVKEPTTEFVFYKERLNEKGKKDNVPSMSVERWSVVLEPLDGGEPINVPSFDNTTARTTQVKIGKRYRAIERYNSELYEAEMASVEIQPGQDTKRNVHTFRNFRKPKQKETTAAAAALKPIPGPAGKNGQDGRNGRNGRDGKGFPKWGWIPIGAGIALGAFALANRGGDDLDVYVKGGVTSNGGGGR